MRADTFLSRVVPMDCLILIGVDNDSRNLNEILPKALERGTLVIEIN